MTKEADVYSIVLERVTPKDEDRKRIEALARRLKRKVDHSSKNLGIEAQTRIEGSVAKDTWLSEEPDIDIFMSVSTTIPRGSLGNVCLEVAKRATEGYTQIERFAEHPYLEAVVDQTRINIVPCYQVKQGEWIGATDRTPFHTDYANEHLTDRKREAVRLLKRFMKGIGVYGAEIRVGGFSGYLCELLILHYESFQSAVRELSRLQDNTVIDLEGYYDGRRDELSMLFDDPLVVVDPVDRGRNVASSVQPQKLFTLVAASRAFLSSPLISFFYPLRTVPLPERELEKRLESLGSSIIFLAFGGGGTVPDILWGQLYKSERSLERLLRLFDFRVLRTSTWSNETSRNVFVLEIEKRLISAVKKHLGPPIRKQKECESFLSKHLDSPYTVSGPYIEDGRWVVETRRTYVDAVALLKDRLKDGGRRAGVAAKIAEELRKGFDVMVNEEILTLYSRTPDFAKYLTVFLSGKPSWL